MMDAAAAAAMSDPTMNRWFRRRWAEQADDLVEPGAPTPVQLDLERLSTELLLGWRRGRVGSETRLS